MKALRVLSFVVLTFLGVSGLAMVVMFLSRSETAGKIYLWTFAAWAAIGAVVLVLLVPVRLYGWLRDRNK